MIARQSLVLFGELADSVRALSPPGWTEADAGLDMGDSAITETAGWGGFALGGAPGILSFTGGSAAHCTHRISRLAQTMMQACQCKCGSELEERQTVVGA